MRWRKRPRPGEKNEHGAAAVTVALLMTVLLGCLAFAVDLGLLYSTKIQLQTGAEAGALAIAQDCVRNGTAACQSTAAATAQDMATKNNTSGVAGITPPVFPGPGTVTVGTAAQNSGGPGVALWFAKIFGLSTSPVSATATAAWGGLTAGVAAVPVTFSECQFNLSGATQVIEIGTGPSCTSSNGTGTSIPGGFGWLDSDAGKCSKSVSLASPTVSALAGLGEPSQCKATFDSLKNQIILLPVYDATGGTGSNAWYHIKGFAAFKLLGFSFTGHDWNNTGSPSCTGSCKGLIGNFVRFVVPGSSWTAGGPDLGANKVSLTK